MKSATRCNWLERAVRLLGSAWSRTGFTMPLNKKDKYKTLMDKWNFFFVKAIHHRFTWGGGGVVLQQLNYPISMLQILLRSVNHIVNDRLNEHCRRCKCTLFN